MTVKNLTALPVLIGYSALSETDIFPPAGIFLRIFAIPDMSGAGTGLRSLSGTMSTVAQLGFPPRNMFSDVLKLQQNQIFKDILIIHHHQGAFPKSGTELAKK
jgi:hypothetical protein